ncbi:MAG: transposase, partial [Rikenellaceae bacterium]
IKENKNHTPKSLMREAIRYAFLMLPRVSRYCSDGRYNIDNNPVERIIRPITIGRKNFLFSKNNKGLVDNCIFYTFIETCKILDIHPIDWFNWVFSKINIDMTESELLELLPVNYLKNKK